MRLTVFPARCPLLALRGARILRPPPRHRKTFSRPCNDFYRRCDSVRSTRSPAPPAPLAASRASLPAPPATLLQRPHALLQCLLPLLHRLLRHNMPCNKPSPPCNDATAIPTSQRRPTKALPPASTLPVTQLFYQPRPFPPYFPHNPPATPPRATQQVAPAPFRQSATQSAGISQAPLRRER